MVAPAKPTIRPRKPGTKRSLDPVAAQRFVAGGGADDATDTPSCVNAVEKNVNDYVELQKEVEPSKVQPLDFDIAEPKPEPLSDESLRPSSFENKRRRRRVLTRARDGRRVRQLTAYLPEHLAKRLAFYCAEHEVDKSTVIAEAVAKFFSES